MASMQFSDFTNALNNVIGDASNFALSITQKSDILTRAFNDNYAVTPVWDNSLTFSIGTYQYALPSDITTVSDVYLERDVSQFPEFIGRDLWEVINGNLQFNNIAHWTIPDQYPLWLKGYYKIKTTDTVSDGALQNYIIYLAAWYATQGLTFTKMGSFLRNDTTVGELLNIQKVSFSNVMEFRRQLAGNDFIAL